MPGSGVQDRPCAIYHMLFLPQKAPAEEVWQPLFFFTTGLFLAPNQTTNGSVLGLCLEPASGLEILGIRKLGESRVVVVQDHI